jgi:formate-dependent nitrite reductase membrane component NrfD/ferredoxin
MYQREDGIVEFDPEACIGCKACLQACPYDAIYIDPDSGTAAKCHYCAHRVDIGLEPACVVVCPEHAILSGDLDNPETEIARAVAENKVTVRKPEQGTSPKLYYIGGDDVAMHPTAVERAPTSFAWADVLPIYGNGNTQSSGQGSPDRAAEYGSVRDAGTTLTNDKKRTPGAQGVPVMGPIMIGNGRMAEQMTQVVYNAQHNVPWHWQVPAYLVTKGIGTGLFMILSLAFGLGYVQFEAESFLLTGFLSLVFMGLTTVLLVADLERPERFLRILTRPQWKSWLVRGAFLLIGFSVVAGIWWALEMASWMDWIGPQGVSALRTPLIWAGLPLAFGAAVYTAFLFGQAEGRDLWQSPLLPVQLTIQAFMAGAAMLLIAGLFTDLPADLTRIARVTFGISVGLDLLVMFLGEFGMPPASEAAAKAGHEITHGRFARSFWIGSIALGHVVPLALISLSWTLGGGLAGAAALVGFYLYEHAFVTAPQQVPNS